MLYISFTTALSVFLFVIIDVLSAGHWKGLDELQDPTLRDLAAHLPSVVLQARQSSTVKVYLAAYKRWQLWAGLFPEIKVFPASSLHISLYLINLLQSAQTCGPINTAFYALSWVHKTGGCADPTDSYLCKMVKESASRLLGHSVVKKLPVTPDMLFKLVNLYASPGASLLNLRLATFCILAYAGFFRYQEISALKASDIVFFDVFMRIFVETAKNDVYREGRWVYIAKTNQPTCPVMMLKRYMSIAQISMDSDCFIFRAVTFFKKRRFHALRPKNVKLSYTTVRENILSAFSSIGLQASLFGSHSLRAGGASAAANHGIPDRLFKRHGRWASEKAKDGYIDDNLEAKLSVSLALGI
jgi:hypothetical protein